MALVEAYIGLGSNLQQPQQQLEQALEALVTIADSCLLAASPLYGSMPMGPQDQPDYVNAVAKLATTLEPLALLDELQAIENRFGRQRLRRWGERTLDLDLLLYGEQIIDLPRLQVPHPGLAQRNFVLYPLVDIAAELEIPGFGKAADLLGSVAKEGLWPLSGGSGSQL